MKKLKPPLKWAGGKRWLVSILQAYWEQHKERRLVEPFCGSLAVTLGLMPRYALLNDSNPHLINFYRWLQKGLKVTIPLKNEKELYYNYRRQFNLLVKMGKGNTREAAQLFYYLNRTGYNGLCRFNSKGEFNVPFGRYKKISYPEGFSEYREILGAWELQSTDFQKITLQREDFIYADPPYDVEFTHYAKEGFGWKDQVRLVEWLAAHPGPVVLSNQATDRIVHLYRSFGYRLTFLKGPRLISCTGDRAPAREILAFKGLKDISLA